MMEFATTHRGPWPWANWDGDDGAVDRRFRSDRPADDSEADAAGRGEGEPTALADGGNVPTACPKCAAPTVSGQGLHWCADCDWTGSR